MPDVVSNTTPLLYLHQLGCLDFLPQQSGLIAALRPYLDQLDKSGFYLGAHVRARILSLAGESP